MRKNRALPIVRFLKRLLFSGVLLLFALYGSLHLPQVQDAIAAEISSRISTPDQQISLHGLRGRWPFSIQLQELTIEDAAGKWLHIEGLTFNWRLQRNRIQIPLLSVQTLEVTRIPDGPEGTLAGKQGGTTFAGIDLELDRVQIETLRVDQALAGQEIRGSVSGSGTLNSREGLLTSFTLTSDIMELDATLTLPPASTLALEGSGNIHRVHAFQVLLQQEEETWTGKVSLETPQPFLFVHQLQEPLRAFGLEPSRWAAYLPADPEVNAPFSVESDVRLAEKTLQATVLMNVPGGKVNGNVTLHREREKLELNLTSDLKSLKPLADVMGVQVVGRLHGTTDLQFEAGESRFRSTLQTTGLQWKGVAAGDSLLTISGDGAGMEGSLTHTMKVAGREAEGSFTFALRPGNPDWNLTLGELLLEVPPFTLSNQSPVSLSLNRDSFTLQPADLDMNGIPLFLEGTGHPEDLDLSITIQTFDAEELPELEGISLDGTLTGGVRLTGNWEKPVADLTCKFEKLGLLLEDANTNLQVNGTAKGTWSSRGLSLRASVSDTNGNHMEADLSSPEGWSLSPFHIPDKTADLTAKMKGQVDLSVLNRFELLENQKIAGQLVTDLRFSRKEGEPSLNGSLQMVKGTYDHFRLGSRLDQIELRVKLEDRLLTIQQATGRTPGGGTVSLGGQWRTETLPGSGSLQLQLQGARLLHLDPVLASVSGTVSVTKTDGESLQLDGDLVLERTEFDMDRLPRPVPEPVAFTVKGAPDPQPVQQVPGVKERAPKGLTAQGDLNLRIPSTLIVKGQNLYSTWMGDFKLSLKPEGLQLNGKLSPRRGTVTFFGRTFRFSKGTVHFHNTLGTPPLLDLEAEYSREDLDAILIINGLANDPSFRLRSNPPLPEDEILSRILFGKDMASITGLQALELGLALRSMMDSEGSGRDLMGKARSFLNVDQLELRESGDAAGSTELVAGRQINNKLYLEVNQSLRTPGTSIILEYEIRRNFSITTETGTHILPGIGVNWKRDY